MEAAQRMAFKEWAAVCAALESGRQTIILRKGGIHEGRDGFRVDHGEFWMFPTFQHETPGELVDDAHPLLERVLAERPAAGKLRISLYAEVKDVVEVARPDVLLNLAGRHILSPHVLDERFHYRQPGLFVLTVRMYRLPTAALLPDSPHFAGCRSWVELSAPLPTTGLAPVLDDDEFEVARNRIRKALTSHGLA